MNKHTTFLSMLSTARLSALIGAAVVLILVVVALIPAVPPLYHMPGTDNAIFLFMGEKILQGDLPFRDWYDHKPPLIFYLNALGLWLTQGSRWGVWVIELASLSAACYLGYVFIRRYFGAVTAALSMGFTLLNLAFVHDRGNLTEEYALPFQFGVIYLLSEIERGGRSGWKLLAIGSMVGMASSLKQPLAGIVVAVFAYLLVLYAGQERWRDLLRSVGIILLGFIIVWLAWFVYFAVIGIFPEFWESAFVYNFALSGIPLDKRFLALTKGLTMLWGWSGYFLAGMLAWLAVFPYLLFHDLRILRAITSRLFGQVLAVGGVCLFILGVLGQNGLFTIGLLLILFSGFVFSGWIKRRLTPWLEERIVSKQISFFLPLLVAFVDLPVALVLTSLSGNNFAHYFMALLPSLSLLVAFTIHSLLSLTGRAGKAPIPYVWLAAMAIPIFAPGIYATMDQIGPRDDRQIEAVIDYVLANTLRDDPIYVWGIATQVNLISGRDAPSRYFFPDPLFVDGYSGEIQTGEFLRDLQSNPPVLIVDALMDQLPLVTVSGWTDCDRAKDPIQYQTLVNSRRTPGSSIPQMPGGIGNVYTWICENYTPEGPVGEQGWMVYRLKGK